MNKEQSQTTGQQQTAKQTQEPANDGRVSRTDVERIRVAITSYHAAKVNKTN